MHSQLNKNFPTVQNLPNLPNERMRTRWALTKRPKKLKDIENDRHFFSKISSKKASKTTRHCHFVRSKRQVPVDIDTVTAAINNKERQCVREAFSVDHWCSTSRAQLSVYKTGRLAIIQHKTHLADSRDPSILLLLRQTQQRSVY